MKGTRLKDVLHKDSHSLEFWNKIFGKLKKLGTAIEMYYGVKMDIDNQEYRWVDDRIEYYETDGRLLTKKEMIMANEMWKKYGA